MKKLLITGANSYIGTSVEKWLRASKNEYEITTLDMRNSNWHEHDFSRYDSVFHVAGLAHFSKDKSKKDLYYRINTDLTYSVAKKAKASGVLQFIFMSSIIVYGDSTNKERIIDRETSPTPTDCYGDSKWQAEIKLETLKSPSFKIAIIRPPMIYGSGSKGNYARLSKLAQKIPIFPDYINKRSMLHIDNLCEFVLQVLENNIDGILFPQNKEYICTADLVKQIGLQHRKSIYLTKFFNFLIPLTFFNDNIKKMFGNLVYEKELSEYTFSYQIRDFKESIYLSEKEQ